MTPDRKQTVNGKLIEEFYWAGRYVTYIDGRFFDGSYTRAIESLGASSPSTGKAPAEHKETP